MVSCQTKAIAQLGITVLTVSWIVSMRRLPRSSDNESHEPTPLSPGGLAVGGIQRVGQVWAYDRDCRKVRSNWRCELVTSLANLVVEYRLFPRIESFMYSLGLGHVLGVVIHRAWYGFLRPLPDGD